MTHIFLIKHRDVLIPVRRIFFSHIPIRHDFHSIRVGMNEENDHIIQDFHRFRISPGSQLIQGLDQLVWTNYLTCMKTTIDPNHRFALN